MVCIVDWKTIRSQKDLYSLKTTLDTYISIPNWTLQKEIRKGPLEDETTLTPAGKKEGSVGGVEEKSVGAWNAST
jgi:hypothetical protein